MDKYEYKVRSEEIRRLVVARQYAEAMRIANTIDWTRVKSVEMLTIVSDIYKINHKLEESKELLLLAYDRQPGGRAIVYSLCELCIRMDELVQAMEYFKEFVQIAPRDSSRYILQYKLYEAQDVRLEERVAVLEEFKKRDPREKWMYELAYLYHRIGLGTQCVEECNEVIIMFGHGKYVTKALELKMLHEALDPVQQRKYDRRNTGQEEAVFDDDFAEEAAEEILPEMLGDLPEEMWEAAEEESSSGGDEIDFEIKAVDVGKYNTINLQRELAESMKEFLDVKDLPPEELPEEIMGEQWEAEELIDEEELPEEPSRDPIADRIIAPLLQETKEIPFLPLSPREDITEVFFEDKEEDSTAAVIEEEMVQAEESETEEPENVPEAVREFAAGRVLSGEAANEFNQEQIPFAERETELSKILSQEYNGQISLVVPQEAQIEKQITGQMNFVEILAEWERMKKENEEKRKEDVRKRVSLHTDAMFTEFEAAMRDDLLAQIEAEARQEISFDKEINMEEIHTEEEYPAGAYAEDTITEPQEMYEDEEDSEEQFEEDSEGNTGEQDDAILADETEGYLEENMEDSAKEPDHGDEAEDAGQSAQPQQEAETDKAEAEENTALRDFTEEEKELFSYYVHSKSDRRQIVSALDKISLASYTGNLMVTGDLGSDTIGLARNVLKAMKLSDSNFSGKVAKVTGDSLNNNDIASIFDRLENGALIVEKACRLLPKTVQRLNRILEQGNKGIIVILEGTKKELAKLMENETSFAQYFDIQIDLSELDNDSLVAFAKRYADESEYAIDELAVLALYTRITDMQTSDHIVNIGDVREIVDGAIRHANKKSLSHFKDILLAKRYDDQDMIILREKDFSN